MFGESDDWIKKVKVNATTGNVIASKGQGMRFTLVKFDPQSECLPKPEVSTEKPAATPKPATSWWKAYRYGNNYVRR